VAWWLSNRHPPPPLTETGEQYGKMDPKYPEGGHCQSVLHPQVIFNVPFILINSVETAAPFNVVVSRKMNPWNFFDLDGIEPVTFGTKCNVLHL